jgi:hypothetical protein
MDFLEHIFYNPEKKFYNEGKINIQSWTADTIKCFIKKYRKPYEDLFKEKAAIETLLQAKEKDPTINWFPEILWDNKKDIMVFEYVGETINSINIPKNYQDQFDKIFSDFLNLKMMHNKIYVKDSLSGPLDSEIMVKDDKMYLVDYSGHLEDIKESNEFEKLLWDNDAKKLYKKSVNVYEYKREIDDFLNNLYEIKISGV